MKTCLLEQEKEKKKIVECAGHGCSRIDIGENFIMRKEKNQRLKPKIARSKIFLLTRTKLL